MILSDRDLAHEISYGGIEIEPFDFGTQLQPNSVDIRLGHEFSTYNPADGVVVDVKDKLDNITDTFEVTEDEGIAIHPDDFYLANTIERIEIPDYLEADLFGRSSVGRLGVEVHSTAGLFDAGFSGEAVLEISTDVDFPVRVYPGMRIAQLVFKELKHPANNPYNAEDNKYQNQEGAVESRIHHDIQ